MDFEGCLVFYEVYAEHVAQNLQLWKKKKGGLTSGVGYKLKDFITKSRHQITVTKTIVYPKRAQRWLSVCKISPDWLIKADDAKQLCMPTNSTEVSSWNLTLTIYLMLIIH